MKDHFPLPFIDQVLDTLVGKKLSFLDRFSGYIEIQVSLEDLEKTNFTFPWGTYVYQVLPFGLCNSPTTFQWIFLGILSELTHDSVEIYMDDFTVYRDIFKEALNNLKKVFIHCQEENISLSDVNHLMLLN